MDYIKFTLHMSRFHAVKNQPFAYYSYKIICLHDAKQRCSSI